MSDLILKSLDIKNFRSIRGQVHAPLDAKVVLVHGENGAGKTSLLSAVELALTGKVQSLERADPGYEKQLLHRSATEGSVLLKTLAGTSEQSFKAVLNAAGAQSITALDEQRATFFRERAFLPQSLLGQLLQIYQDAGNDAASPLAQFVGKLLGLDRLDALEAGLKSLADVRNVRKNVDGWLVAENEKSRLDRLLSDQRSTRDALDEQIRSAVSELATLCTALELSVEVREETLDEVAAAFSDGNDSEAFARLTDQQRRLASIRREIEWALRLALECRRRVKEQQKRIGTAEFRNTQFSYTMGLDGVEKFVATPELQSEDSIGPDPLSNGQVWAISPGGQDEAVGLYRIEVNEGPGGGVRILNQAPPAPFRESVRIAEQNLYARTAELVGDRNPREHELTVQLRSFDAAKLADHTGVPVLLALSSALLGTPLKGGMAVVGGINLGGSIEPVHNPIDVVEHAMSKGASTILMPVSCRRQLVDLSDDVATKVQVLYYADAADALRKVLHDG